MGRASIRIADAKGACLHGWTVDFALSEMGSHGGFLAEKHQDIKKQRHYFANKVPSRKATFFPVVMYGCES